MNTKTALLISWVVLLAGCFELGPSRPPQAFRLPVPSPDEVLVVDGRALSIAGFEYIRSQVPSQSVDTAIWAATAALAIQNETRLKNREINAATAINVVRYALSELSPGSAESSVRDYVMSAGGVTGAIPSPGEIRLRLEKLVASSAVQQNPRLLAELR